MKKPYIICHMMTSVDGRIDCAMTEHLPGVQEYYDTLDALNAPTRVSGRVTAEQTGAAAGSNRGEEERLAPFWAENARNGTKSAENLTDFFKKVWKSTCIP